MKKNVSNILLLFLFCIASGVSGYLLNGKSNQVLNDITTVSKSSLINQHGECEFKKADTCDRDLICTGIADLDANTRAGYLMSEYKARGFAVTKAVDFINRITNQDKLILDRFVANYKTVESSVDEEGKLVYVSIALQCF